MEIDRETQKYCGLINKTHYFIIHYKNKSFETNKTFERGIEESKGLPPLLY